MPQISDLARWRTRRKGLTFHLKIYFHIPMGCVEIDMAEPVFDNSEVNSATIPRPGLLPGNFFSCRVYWVVIHEESA
jgi:hypothetical protein